MRSQRSVLAVLLALMVMGLPITAHAVDVTVQVVTDLNGTFTQTFPSGDSVDLGSASAGTFIPAGCGPGAQVCVQILPTSKAMFDSTGSGLQALGMLTLNPFIAKNLGIVPVLIVVTYGHTNPAVMATDTLCSGMSLSGFFDGTPDVLSVDPADFTDASMTVTWVGCNGPNCNTPFQIGGLGLAPCPNTIQASSGPTVIGQMAGASTSFGPAAPPQVLNLIPQACNNCTASARIDKTYRTRLGPGDSSNTIGTDLAFTSDCGPEKEAFAHSHPMCRNQLVDGTYFNLLLAEQIRWFFSQDAIPGPQKGGLALSHVLDNVAFKCTDIDYMVGMGPRLSVPGNPGAPLNSVHFKTGACDITHEVSQLTGFTCDTRILELTGTINGVPFGPIGTRVRPNCAP